MVNTDKINNADKRLAEEEAITASETRQITSILKTKIVGQNVDLL